ncbi:MAG: hypothetical protein IPM37_19685 [Hahellaceae bacterium]|nr:hypothetical protein [Hahellaceae bacterium]
MDNNSCERLLKIVIKYRKNSLFFGTAYSASYLSTLMSVIATAQLNHANVLQYLTVLQEHEAAVWRAPVTGCRGTITRRCRKRPRANQPPWPPEPDCRSTAGPVVRAPPGSDAAVTTTATTSASRRTDVFGIAKIPARHA